MTDYAVIYEKSATGWSAYSPDLPGVYALGESREVVEQRMEEGILGYLEFLEEFGMEVPAPEIRAKATARRRGSA